MKKIKKQRLKIWLQTGYREQTFLGLIWRIITSPILMIGVAIISVVAMIIFNITEKLWMWAIAPSAMSLAILIILLRHRARVKMQISKKQAKRYNKFQNAAMWLPQRYLNRIDTKSERTDGDNKLSIEMYRRLGEAFIMLALYDSTKRAKTKNGVEYTKIEPITYYVDFVLDKGVGYILIEPSIGLMENIEKIDGRIISQVIREIGKSDWTVERVDYEDDIMLFILSDEKYSKAYDFGGE